MRFERFYIDLACLPTVDEHRGSPYRFCRMRSTMFSSSRSSNGASFGEISGVSEDARDIIAVANAGMARAAFALEMYVHRLRARIAALAAATNGFHVLPFRGGVASIRLKSAIAWSGY